MTQGLSSIPLTTLTFLGINIGIYGVQMLFPVPLSWFSIAAAPVLHGQVHRLVTSALMHMGILHIVMNMMSFYYMGISLEPLFGTTRFHLLLNIFIIIEGVIYVAICYALAILFGANQFLYSSGIGFSGVLFALAVQESFLSTAQYRSVFGLFRVPTKWYPWVLLIVLQVILPGVSFLGHLSGLLVGLLYVTGWLYYVTPSQTTLEKLEASDFRLMVWARQKPNFCALPEHDPVAMRLGWLAPDQDPSMTERVLDRMGGLWASARESIAGRAEASAPREPVSHGARLGQSRESDIEEGAPLRDSESQSETGASATQHLPVGDGAASAPPPSSSPRSAGSGGGGGRANLSSSRLVREAEERRQAQLQRERDARQIGSQGRRTEGVNKKDWR